MKRKSEIRKKYVNFKTKQCKFALRYFDFFYSIDGKIRNQNWESTYDYV